MRISIIPSDQVVVVNGVAMPGIDMSALDPSIHAIQWYGDHGELEIRDLQQPDRISIIRNEMIANMAPYQPLIDQWQIKRDQRLAAEAAEAIKAAEAAIATAKAIAASKAAEES